MCEEIAGTESRVDTIERRAILTLALAAALVRGTAGERERELLGGVAESLGRAADIDGAALFEDALRAPERLPQLAALLGTLELRRLAFEVALGVCDADALRDEPQTRFLAALGAALALEPAQMAEPAAVADALATAPLAGHAPAVDAAGLDRLILNAAVFNGALERLPHALAALAIIPLQMRLVYRIGQAHGDELDRRRVKELLAAMGLAPVAQYLDRIGRALAQGWLDAAAGRSARTSVHGAIDGAFVATHALGHTARLHYAGGRAMAAPALREAFAALLKEARAVRLRVRKRIERQARTIDVGRLALLVREG